MLPSNIKVFGKIRKIIKFNVVRPIQETINPSIKVRRIKHEKRINQIEKNIKKLRKDIKEKDLTPEKERRFKTMIRELNKQKLIHLISINMNMSLDEAKKFYSKHKISDIDDPILREIVEDEFNYAVDSP